MLNGITSTKISSQCALSAITGYMDPSRINTKPDETPNWPQVPEAYDETLSSSSSANPPSSDPSPIPNLPSILTSPPMKHRHLSKKHFVALPPPSVWFPFYLALDID
jgi:hypothetical protein